MELSQVSAGSGSAGARQQCDWVGAGEMGHSVGPMWKELRDYRKGFLISRI
jgi:hypothetical protein